MSNYSLNLTAPLISHRDAIVKYIDKFREYEDQINDEDRGLLSVLDSYDSYGEWVVDNTTGRSDGSSTFFVIDKSNGEIVGNANIRFDCELADRCGNIGYAIRPDLRGRGIGTELVDLLVTMCRMLGKNTIKAVVLEDNISSARVLEKNGFVQYLCKNGRKYYTISLVDEMMD